MFEDGKEVNRKERERERDRERAKEQHFSAYSIIIKILINYFVVLKFHKYNERNSVKC